MKGVGRKKNWKVVDRCENSIVWKKTSGKTKKVAMWKVGLGGGKTGYEVCSNFPKGKVSVHKKKDNALKKVKTLMR